MSDSLNAAERVAFEKWEYMHSQPVFTCEDWGSVCNWEDQNVPGMTEHRVLLCECAQYKVVPA